MPMASTKPKAKAAAKGKAKSTPKSKPKVAAKAAAPAGDLEAASWVAARKLSTAGKARWYVRIALDVVDAPAAEVYSSATDTRFHLDLYRDEWGVLFVHKGKASHVRRTATDQFINGTDQHKLRGEMPALADVGTLVRSLEKTHKIVFQRAHASIRSNLTGAKSAIRDWLATL